MHGSQLVNQVFMRPGGTIIEFFHHKFVHYEPQVFGDLMGIHHEVIANNSLPSDQTVMRAALSLLPLYKQCLELSQ